MLPARELIPTPDTIFVRTSLGILIFSLRTESSILINPLPKTLGGREEFLVQLQHNIEDVLNGDSTATLEYID